MSEPQEAAVVREALTLAATLPLSVPEAHYESLLRLDALVMAANGMPAFAALDALVVRLAEDVAAKRVRKLEEVLEAIKGLGEKSPRDYLMNPEFHAAVHIARAALGVAGPWEEKPAAAGEPEATTT